mgnify:CR=1 FL=1
MKLQPTPCITVKFTLRMCIIFIKKIQWSLERWHLQWWKQNIPPSFLKLLYAHENRRNSNEWVDELKDSRTGVVHLDYNLGEHTYLYKFWDWISLEYT